MQGMPIYKNIFKPLIYSCETLRKNIDSFNEQYPFTAPLCWLGKAVTLLIEVSAILTYFIGFLIIDAMITGVANMTGNLETDGQEPTRLKAA